MRRASAGGRTSFSPCFVPGCRFAPLKIAASGARALLAMTQKMVSFAEKRNVDSARKRLHPAKNVCFSNITVSNLCHCEERSDMAILKPKVWHPMARHGGRNRQNQFFDPSRRDSTTALLRKRHFTRTQVRISHAQHLSLAQRANFTAQPTAPLTKSFAGAGFAGFRKAPRACFPRRSVPRP